MGFSHQFPLNIVTLRLKVEFEEFLPPYQKHSVTDVSEVAPPESVGHFLGADDENLPEDSFVVAPAAVHVSCAFYKIEAFPS